MKNSKYMAFHAPSGIARYSCKMLMVGSIALLANTSLLAIQASAQNIWTGNTSNDWYAGSNWSSLASPTDTDVVIINGGQNLPVMLLQPTSSDLMINSLYVGSTLAGAGSGIGRLNLESGYATYGTLLMNTSSFVGQGTGANGEIQLTAGRMYISSGDLNIGTAGGTGKLTGDHNSFADNSDIYLNRGGIFAGVGQGSNAAVILNDTNIYADSGADNYGIMLGLDGGIALLSLTESSQYKSSVYVYGKSVWGSGPGGRASVMIDLVTVHLNSSSPYYDPSAISLSAGVNSGYAEINLLNNGKGDYGHLNFNTQGFLLGTSGGTGILNMDKDAGMVAEFSRLGDGTGSNATVNILGGGKMLSGEDRLEGPVGVVVASNGGVASVNISGIGNFATASGLFTQTGFDVGTGAGSVGTVNVTGTGQLNTLTGNGLYGDSYFIRLGLDGGTGSVAISGNQAVWHIGSDMYGLSQQDPVSDPPADLYVGYSGTGNLTISNQGSVSVGWVEIITDCSSGSCIFKVANFGSTGLTYIANQAGSSGYLTIGSAPGAVPQASGLLFTAGILFGAGNGTLNFNITDVNHQFTIPVTGTGTIANYAGTTWLAADNSGFSGTAALYGGTLGLNNSNSIGASTVSVLGNAVLAYNDAVSISNAIALTGANTLSTLVGSGFSAFQTGQISGTGNLAKSGTGTLTLTAANIYSGATSISEGVLALSGAGSISQSALVLVDSMFDVSGVTAGSSAIRSLAGSGSVVLGTNDLVITAGSSTFAGIISGAGGLQVTGGRQILSGPNTYLGNTLVSAGTLSAGAVNTFSPISGYTVLPGAAMELRGFSQTVASLDNAGMVRLGNQPGAILTVTGAYTSNGGTLAYEAVLAADDSLSDRMIADHLVIGPGGQTKITVTNIGGPGAQTTGNGIELVHVNNGTSAGAFSLQGRAAAGLYEYQLFHGGIGAEAGNENWYLRSSYVGPSIRPLLRPEVAVDSTVPALASRFGIAMLGTWRDRTGNEPGMSGAGSGAASTDDGHGTFVWGRLFGETGKASPGAENFMNHGPSYDFGLGGFQAGMDVFRRSNTDGSRDIAGLYIGGGRATADVRVPIDIGYGAKAGDAATDGASAGAYYTHIGAGGWYIDAVAQTTRYWDVKTTSVAPQPEMMKTNGWGFAGSLEGGYPVQFAHGWAVEPQAQILYQHISLDNTADSYARINYGDIDAAYGRIGARVSNDWAFENGRKLTLWARANLWTSFGASSKTSFNGSAVKTDLGTNWGQLGLGVSGQVAENVSLYAGGDYNFALEAGSGHSLSGRAGVKVKW